MNDMRGEIYYMKRMKKALVTLAVMAMTASMFPANVFATTPNRFAGVDRYQTASLIADEVGSPNKVAILTAGMDANLVDALAAAPFASSQKAPILLTEGTELNNFTQDELTRLAVNKVYLTSGSGVIEKPVTDELTALGISFEFVGGEDRYETSLNLAKKLSAPTGVIVASANDANIVDSLSVASIAAANNMAIVLTDKDGMSSANQSYIRSLNVPVYVIGGNGVISDSVVTSLGATRVGGANRYATNIAVLNQFKANVNFDTVYAASGNNLHLVDALAGAPLAAKTKSAIVLSDGAISSEVSNFIITAGIKNVVALGSANVVPEGVRTGLVYTPPTTTPPVVNPPVTPPVSTGGGGGWYNWNRGGDYTPAVDAVVPVITTDLVNQQTTTGTAITLDATATVNGAETLSYQWYSSTDGTTTGSAIAEATSATYTSTMDTAGTFYYYCVVTNTNNAATGIKTASTTSNVATINVSLTVQPKEITDFTPLTAISLITDEHLVDLTTFKASGKLPTIVTVTDGTTSADADITDWTGTFDATTTGAITLTATWTMPVGYVNTTTPIAVTIIVNVNTVQTVAPVLSSAKDMTSFSFDGLTPAVTGTITGTSITLTVPNATDVTVLVATFANSTASAITVGATTQVSGITVNDFTSPVTYTVTAEDGTIATYTVTVTIAAPLSSDATLKTSSTVKGQPLLDLGTPNVIIGSTTPGAITILAVEAADTTNVGLYITLFDKNDVGATVKVVKYASADPTTSFATDSAYANEAITDGDFFIVKVTAADGSILYYNIIVTVI